jgi:hypothetical protein
MSAVVESAKPATSAAPVTENIQKTAEGRSPARNTPNRAVQSGSSPMKTIDWADVMLCSASAVSSGNPTTTPSATMARDSRSLRSGRFSRRVISRAAPRRAAITARAEVRNSGAKSDKPTRVAGSEPLKISTPMKPLAQALQDVVILISFFSALPIAR